MITIAFFSSNELISKIIRFLTNSKVSHSAIGLELDGVKYFLHADTKGVNLVSRSNFLKEDYLIDEFEVIPNIEEEVFCGLRYIGKKYDYTGLVGFLPMMLFRIFGIKITNILNNKSSYFCSEFIVDIDKFSKIKEFSGIKPGETSPKDLYKIVSSGSSFRNLKN